VLTYLSDKARLREPIAAASPPPSGKKKLPPNLGPEWVIATVGEAKVLNGIPANTARLLSCATQLRGRMSLDHWRTVQRLAHLHEPAPQSLEAALAILDRVVPVCTALAGYAFDDMTRDDAWRFLVMGRHLERITFLSSAAMQILGLPDEDCDAALSALLEIGNVSMTYRARYQRHPELLPVLDLMALDELNPHSVCFQMAALGFQLQQVGTRLGFRPVNDLAALLQTLRGFDLAELEAPRPAKGEPLAALLAACERFAYGLSDELTQRFFIHAGEQTQTSVAA
jgi:uncharacterized alpha-E superfamily protein